MLSASSEDAVLEERAASLVLSHERLLEDLVKLRHHHNLKQAEVAERMGVSQPTVAAFERYDANPTLATIRRYAHAVGARLDDRVLDDCHHNTDNQFNSIMLEEFGQVFSPARQTEWVSG